MRAEASLDGSTLAQILRSPRVLNPYSTAAVAAAEPRRRPQYGSPIVTKHGGSWSFAYPTLWLGGGMCPTHRLIAYLIWIPACSLEPQKFVASSHLSSSRALHGDCRD